MSVAIYDAVKITSLDDNKYRNLTRHLPTSRTGVARHTRATRERCGSCRRRRRTSEGEFVKRPSSDIMAFNIVSVKGRVTRDHKTDVNEAFEKKRTRILWNKYKTLFIHFQSTV